MNIKGTNFLNRLDISSDKFLCVCDFFDLAQAWENDFYIDKNSEFSEHETLEFYTSEKLDILRETVRKNIHDMLAENEFIFLVEAIFDAKNCNDAILNRKLQKINWILEEIYDQFYDIPRARICRLGKIAINKAGIEASLDSFYNPDTIAKIYKTIDKEYTKIGFVKVTASIKGSTLTASVEHKVGKNSKNNYSYCFYLIKDKVFYDKGNWISKNTKSWKLSEDGIYYVRAFVKYGNEKLSASSKPFSYYTKKTTLEFKEFLDNDNIPETPFDGPPELYILKKPFSNIIVVSHKTTRNCTEISAFTEKFSSFDMVAESNIGGYNTYVFSCHDKPKTLSNGTKMLFSGIANYNGKFIIGQDDIPNDMPSKDISLCIGNFTNVNISEDEIHLGNDFFNMNQWFYFENDDFFIAANSYHSLLCYMNISGIKSKLNINKAATILSYNGSFLASQNFSRTMDIEGTYQVELDKNLHLTSKGWVKKQSECGKVLLEDRVFHESEYSLMLKNAAMDIKRNIECVFNDERFKVVNTDLSGGLDSRLVYAAVTNLPDAKSKVKICTGSLEDGDLEIGTAINSIYGYDYNDCPVTVEYVKYKNSSDFLRSFYMGTYYTHNPSITANTIESSISLSGGCGEIVARPIADRTMLFNTIAEYCENEDEMATFVATEISNNCVAAINNAKIDFSTYLLDELKAIPVRNLIQRFDKFYLYYRNLYHFSVVSRWQTGKITWTPIQSVPAFKLHYLTQAKFKNIKYEIDLIAQLNPILANIRYNKPRDQEEFINIRDTLEQNDPRFRNINITGSDDIARWQKAENYRKKNSVYVQSRNERIQITTEANDYKQIIFSSLLKNFRELMIRCPQLRDNIGVALYKNLSTIILSKQKLNNMYNKITSLLDQVRLMDNSD